MEIFFFLICRVVKNSAASYCLDQKISQMRNKKQHVCEIISEGNLNVTGISHTPLSDGN